MFASRALNITMMNHSMMLFDGLIKGGPIRGSIPNCPHFDGFIATAAGCNTGLLMMIMFSEIALARVRQRLTLQ